MSNTNGAYEASVDLLRGAIDIHVHPGPNLKANPRYGDPIQVAKEARDCGMKALVFMDVFQDSSGIAWLTSRHVPGIHIFGGLILNTIVRGLNPRAVKTALHYGDGAKFVGFGTHSTHYSASREARWDGTNFVPICETDERFQREELAHSIKIPLEGSSPALDEILDEIAQHPDVFLRTGHVSPEEAINLLQLARSRGITKLLVASIVARGMTGEQRRQAISLGAYLEVYLLPYTQNANLPKANYYTEKEWMDERPPSDTMGIRKLASLIRQVGVENIVASTDFGSFTLSSPTEGMRQFIACLLQLDLTPLEIRRMVSINPSDLLGLPQD